VTVKVKMGKIMELREKLNKVSKTKISINDMVIKAISSACMKVPETNSHWLEKEGVIRQFKNVNMSIAVQTDRGLMSPVLFNSNLKGIE
jgi:pyruvate dehydrogenase E2 component (dihydrolipoamide acetyltransferase)